MSVDIRTHTNEKATVVRVSGEVDVSNAAELRSAIEAAFAEDVASVEVNLSEVDYIDSTGIGVLVGAAHRADDAHIAFRVAEPQRNVARVLGMLGVDKELGVGD